MRFRIHRFHDEPLDPVALEPILNLAYEEGLSLYSPHVEASEPVAAVIRAYVRARVLMHGLSVGRPGGCWANVG